MILLLWKVEAWTAYLKRYAQEDKTIQGTSVKLLGQTFQPYDSRKKNPNPPSH